ncbi:MAG: hypothetical protein WCV90_08255 [Candidatus Woesearchaeota archaeon]|jgi:hypothetical protein
MGLEDLFLKADMAIWNGFEKATTYCQDHFGYSKYDLAKRAEVAGRVSLFGMAAYFGLATILQGNYSTPAHYLISLGFVGGVTAVEARSLAGINERYQKAEDRELELITETGCPSQPKFSGWRAFKNIYVPLSFVMAGIYSLVTNTPMPACENHPELCPQLSFLVKSAAAGALLAVEGGFGAEYFLEQVYVPPTTQKGVLKAIRDKFSRKKKVLQLAPEVVKD